MRISFLQLISENQLVAIPRPLNVVGSGFSSAPASQAPTVATSPVGEPTSSQTSGAVPQDLISAPSSATSSLSHLIRSRPHGPPPPAPEVFVY